MALGSSFISDSIAQVWLEAKTFIPGVQLGGIYANKPWYHNTRAANDANWPGNYSVSLPLDRLGPSTISAAIDLTMSTAEMIKRTGYLRKAALDANDHRTKYIRELLGTTNGTDTRASLRHDSETGTFYTIQPDSSHLWHIHLSFFRKYAADMTAAKAIISILKGESYAQYLGGEDFVTTPAEFLALLKDPTVHAYFKAVAWQYVGGGIDAGKSTLGVLDEIHQNSKHIQDPVVATVDVAAVAAAVVAALPPGTTSLTAAEVTEAVKAALREGAV